MTKKSIIACTALSAVLMALIAVGVVYLYADVAVYDDEVKTVNVECDVPGPQQVQEKISVAVPDGPFEVSNSLTGKKNVFSQAGDLSLSLADETGKQLWSVPFSDKLCGRAADIDYYSNGKKQIIFAAGKSIHILTRLGTYVKGFPVSLPEEVLLGPDVYDFSSKGKYNILVLHKANNIEMYNLSGVKPDLWKGIKPSETVIDLPMKIDIDGRTYWAVRTVSHTLVYSFYGGDVLKTYSRDVAPADIIL